MFLLLNYVGLWIFVSYPYEKVCENGKTYQYVPLFARGHKIKLIKILID